MSGVSMIGPGWLTTALLGALVLVLGACGQAVAQATSTAQAPGPGSFVEVEGSKLYFEECGTGSEAVVLIHDGIAHSAVWDDVWPDFCKKFHTIPRPLGTPRSKIWPRFCVSERSVERFSSAVRTAANFPSTSLCGTRTSSNSLCWWEQW